MFTVQQLAELIHKKPATIYSDLIRRPSELPPVFRASPTSKPLFVNPRSWILEKVQHQQRLQEAGFSELRKATDVTEVRIRRGRPSNLARQQRKEEKKKGGEV